MGLTFGSHFVRRFGGWRAVFVMLATGCAGKSSSQAEAPAVRATDSANPLNHACTFGDCEPIGVRVIVKPSPSCPTSKPEKAQRCDLEGSICSYGDSLTAYCRDYFQCVDGTWQSAPEDDSRCVTQPEGFCPSEPPAGAACVVSDVDPFVPCEYADAVTCYCAGRSGTPSIWECYGPPRSGQCPEVLPNLGDGCSTSAQFCGYGIESQGCDAPYANVFCHDGAWEKAGSTCAD